MSTVVPSLSFLWVIRVIDSITALTSFGPRIVVRSPTSTRPVTSLKRSILVGLKFRIDIHRRRHRVAARDTAARADQVDHAAARAGHRQRVKRVVRIVAGVIVGTRRDYCAVDPADRRAGFSRECRTASGCRRGTSRFKITIGKIVRWLAGIQAASPRCLSWPGSMSPGSPSLL